MKVLITGARGNFATALVPRLSAEGHELVLFDLEPMDAPEGSANFQADIRDAGAVVHALESCDAVIHTVAYHSNSLSTRNYNDFYGVNVTGTHNVLRGMLMHGIRYMVFSSTDAVYGDGMRGIRIMDEDVACIPRHFAPMTTLIGEQMCEFYARHHNFHIAILRYGCFLPTDWHTAGIGRLTNWIDREDVAQANELALGAILAEEFSCEKFLIQSAKPFTDEDWPELAMNPEVVVERYFPGSVDLLARNGMHVPHIHTRYDISKAVALLGYEPQHNFEQFLSRLRNR